MMSPKRGVMSPKRGGVAKYEYFQICEPSSDDDMDQLILRDSFERRKICDFRRCPGLLIVVALCLVLIVSASVLGVYLTNGVTSSQTSPLPDGSPDNISEYLHPSVLGNYSTGAIAIDGEPCAKIGKDILLIGGSAVDSAIAALVCNGVVNSQSMGLGGGFLMTVYNAARKTADTLNAREAAPLAAHQDMFHGDPELAKYGPLSVAVPGEVAGYWEARQKYGNKSISWQTLFQPTIDMCRNGIYVSWTHAKVLKDSNFTDDNMKKVFHDPKTGEPWKEGDIYTRKTLAKTLETLARDGDAGKDRLGFYTGDIGKKLVQDLKELKGIITEEDLKVYEAIWQEPAEITLNSLNMTVFSIRPPGSGAILEYILNIIDNYKLTKSDKNDPLLFHRIVEAFKWAYALRTELGDPIGDVEIKDIVHELVQNMTSEDWAEKKFHKIKDNMTNNNASYYGASFYSPDDHGTAHVSILAPNGDAVSATSTINLYFGSKVISPSTGIIYNDEMDDFSAPSITNYFGLPPSPHNFIRPHKRPLSSMSPAIVTDGSGDVRLVVGAAGGTKITTATALTMIHNLWLGDDIKESIDFRRIHHQLVPMEVVYELDYPQNILKDLESRGHRVATIDAFGSVVCAVARGEDGRIYANADFRKAGGVDGF